MKANKTLAQRKPPPAPDLTIELFDMKGRKGTIYCKEMKCEIHSGNVRKSVTELMQEWLDLREAYL